MVSCRSMEVSLKLIENGGTIVYNPEAIINMFLNPQGLDFLPNAPEMQGLTHGL